MVLMGTAFVAGLLFSPLGAAILIIPTATKLYWSWLRCALVTVLSLICCSLGAFLIPDFTARSVLAASKIPYADYLKTMLPLALIGLIIALSAAACFIFFPPDYSPKPENDIDFFDKYITNGIYILLFILCVLSHFGIIDIIVSFCSAVLAAVILNSDNFRKVDYGLLVIVFLLSVSAWNIMRTDMIPLPENPFAASVFLTQFIGADNAAVMLYPKNVPSLLLLSGGNIGSIGLITASVASIYSYRQCVNVPGSKPILSLCIFTGVGLAFVMLLSAAVLI
jgi:hypothetical protein